MAPVIDQVKERATRFHDDIIKELERLHKDIAKVRVKVIAYRDVYVDNDAAFSESPFFLLPDQNDQFKGFVDGIRAKGGGDEPESGLEALALALRAEWTREGDRQRHALVIWTDASAHKLPGDLGIKQEDCPRAYPKGLPGSLDALTDSWHSQEMNAASRRLLLFAPDAYPWNQLAENWDNTLQYTSRAGEGLKEIDYATMLDLIARSVG